MRQYSRINAQFTCLVPTRGGFIQLPADPKGPPLVPFKISIFGRATRKNFLKAPIYTNFEGGARAEKTQFFWSKFSEKCLKTPESLAKMGTEPCLGRARKIKN